ncbi:MAG: PaaI family thioesterase [Betaproteobacteria bacterium]|nr:PaaI family thioesterase [Betaproteobacteria bacterium]MCC6248988.1 PaaI family thioesterase [Rubrivivax sp.]MCL4698311.1 PaaI family thioesterase [Burkholderiaceae bacterium]
MTYDLPTARRFFAASPFMVDLGVEPVAISEGRVTTVLPIAHRHLQHTGQVHAGVMATIADHTMGAAGQTLAAEGFWIITAELKTSLLRPGKGERLVCEAWVVKPGRMLTFTEAEVYAEAAGGQRTLVMKASATMALVARSA